MNFLKGCILRFYVNLVFPIGGPWAPSPQAIQGTTACRMPIVVCGHWAVCGNAARGFGQEKNAVFTQKRLVSLFFSGYSGWKWYAEVFQAWMIWLMFFADIFVGRDSNDYANFCRKVFFSATSWGAMIRFDEYLQVLPYPFRLGDAIMVNVGIFWCHLGTKVRV